MCGIAGWMGCSLEEGACHDLLDGLAHRGPDGLGQRRWPRAGLLHTRLSIIDLSAAGDQPLANEDGSIWAVCNGEIYNHRELRRDLEGRGHRFRGGSDCEVLPHLYEHYGDRLFERLRGMFAIAIYDASRDRMLLGRDRFGIKPLFVAEIVDGRSRTSFAFASELAALLTVPGVDTTPDLQALSDFTALGYVPAPQTFYRGVRAVEPGQRVALDCRRDVVTRHTALFHRWELAPDPHLTLDEARDSVDELVSQGVARQLESDVKLGAQLSGGIDSSLVVAAAQERLGSLSTFSVQFADPDYDETWAATAVARHVNSRHEVLQMGPGHGDWNHVVSLLQAAGQPYGDTSLFAANEVSALMRQRVTVALSGDGGDEAFGGYAPFTHLNRIARFRRLPSLVGRGAVTGARGLARIGALGPRVPDHLQSLVSGRDAGIVQHLMCWVRQPEQHRLLPELDVLPVSRHFEPMWQLHSSPELTPVDRLSARFTEAKTRLALPNDYLFKVDLASMRHGLEIRVPLLDEQLFEYALRLPHRLKASGREGKLVLRSVAARRLPRAVARKAKHGFGVPVDSWMADTARDAAADRAASQQRRDRGSTARCMHRSRSPSAERRDSPGISREGLHQRVMMLLSVELSLQASRRRTGARLAGGP